MKQSTPFLRTLKQSLQQVVRYGLFAVLGLLGASAWQWQQLHSIQPPPTQATVSLLQAETPDDKAFAPQALERLSLALQQETVSYQQATELQQKRSQQAFDALHQQFQRHYPRIYAQLKPRRLGNSLLVHWPGRSEEAILLAAHLDVVPAQAEHWQHPPFSGDRLAGFVWGRGALDNKASALAILEAVERLLAQGHQPRHGIYVALGEDEEVGGALGAQRMASHLREQGVKLAAVLDEGMLVVPGSMIGLNPPVALIGLAEKGYLSLQLKVEQAGGHSSMPARETAVDILAQALIRLREHPLPAHLRAPTDQLFAWLAPEMGGFRRWALANLWLTEPLLLAQLQQKPATAALVQTTLAPTMLRGSAKENVLASEAALVINLRVLPGDTPEAIVEHFQQAIADERVHIETLSADFSGKASRVSSTETPIFGRLAQSIRQTFPEALVAPSLVLAATDSRHYEGLAEDTYRFQPVALTEADLDRLHGHNERISELSYLKSIGFFEQFLINLQGLDALSEHANIE